MKKVISIFAIISLSCGVELYCKFKINGKSYWCDEPKFNKIEETRELTAIFGEHVVGMTNKNVHRLNIYKNANLSFIPNGIGNFFSNLKTLFISNCENLKELDGRELMGLKNLTFLSIRGSSKLEKNSLKTLNCLIQ